MENPVNIWNDLSGQGYVALPEYVSVKTCEQVNSFIAHRVRVPLSTKGVRYNESRNFTHIISDAFALDYCDGLPVGRHAPEIMGIVGSVFMDPFLIRTTSYYLGEDAVHSTRIQLNQTRDIPENYSEIPFVPHFDRVRFLKFYVFLEDLSAADGAICFGTTNWVQQAEELRALGKEQGLKWPELCPDNQLTSYNGSMKSIEGKAGTLLIFDSNQPHSHGPMLSGKIRQVLIIECQVRSEIRYAYNDALIEAL